MPTQTRTIKPTRKVAVDNRRLSFAQLEGLWIKAGGSPSLAPLMAAIALAESGGRISALNSTPPDYSVGLWQINYYGGNYAARSRRYGSPEKLRSSPLANARAAVDLAKGGRGLTNWTTYANGAYARFLPTGGANPNYVLHIPHVNPRDIIPFPGLPLIIPPRGIPGLPKLPSPTGILKDLLNPVTSYLVRGAQIVAGFTLIVLGIILVSRQAQSSSPARQVSQAASDVGKIVGEPRERELAGMAREMSVKRRTQPFKPTRVPGDAGQSAGAAKIRAARPEQSFGEWVESLPKTAA